MRLMVLGWALLCAVGWAEGQHTGVPTTGIEGFAPPHYQSFETGWHALVPDGLVRVYVHPDPKNVTAWVEKMKAHLVKHDPQPYPPENATPSSEIDELSFAFDEAYGDGEGLLIFRDGNVGILVYVAANAKLWAARTSAAITDEHAPWPPPPRLRKDEMGWWHLEAPGSAHLSYIGGERMDGPSLTFYTPPRAAVAWDEFGRATRADFNADGIITTVQPNLQGATRVRTP